jgi:putative PEP-CTERM system TPR-repeat lipoprotein
MTRAPTVAPVGPKLGCSWRTVAVCAAIAVLAVVSGCDYFSSPQTRIAKAEAAAANDDLRSALILLKGALDRAPHDVHGRLLLADVSLRLGRPLDARRELERASADNASPAEIARLRYRIALTLGEFASTADALATPQPGLPDVERLAYRAVALAGLRRYSEIVAAYQEAAPSLAGHTDLRSMFAGALLSAGDVADATRETEALVKGAPNDPHGYLLRAELLAAAGRRTDALRAYRDAAARAPASGDVRAFVAARAGLITTLLALGRIQEAEPVAAELSEGARDVPIAMVTTAKVALARQQYSAVVDQLTPLVTRAPDLVDARWLLALAHVALGSLNQAETQLLAIVQSNPNFIPARRLLAEVQWRAGRPDNARATLEPLVTPDSRDAESLALAGRIALGAGAYADATAMLDRAQALAPYDIGIGIERAATDIASGQTGRAEALLASMPDVPAGECRTELPKLIVMEARRERDAAQREVAKFVTTGAVTAQTHLCVALYRRLMHDSAEAEREYRAALALDRGNREAQLGLVGLDLAAGRRSQAEQGLRTILQAYPHDTSTRMLLAGLAAARDDGAAQREWLESARKDDPKAIAPRLALARLLVRQGNVQDARAAVNEALAIDPHDVLTLVTAAEIEQSTGQLPRAATLLESAERAAPTRPEIRFALAQVYLALHRPTDAEASFRRVIADRPTWLAPKLGLARAVAGTAGVEPALAILKPLEREARAVPAVLAVEGELLLAAHRPEAASDVFERAYVLSPSGWLAINRYRALRARNEQDADAPLRDWLRGHPDDAQVGIVLAEYFESKDDRPGAIRTYEAVLAGSPDNWVALNNVAVLYTEANDGRAPSVARRAYTLSAGRIPSTADTLGWALLRAGQPQEGLRYLREAASAMPDVGEVQYHYAAALQQTGNESAARQILEKALAKRDHFRGRDDAERLLRSLLPEAGRVAKRDQKTVGEM